MALTWLGHAGFQLEVSHDGKKKRILIDPWLGGPTCPAEFKEIKEADVVLVTHGHFDHSSSAPDISKKTGAKIICIHEVGDWMKKQGVADDKVVGMNKGGTVELWKGCSVTMVNADHSSSCPGDSHFITGGAAAGFVIACAGLPTIYHTGDSNVFCDMKIISDLYAPTVALMCIGGHYTMAPKEAAYALDKLLLSVKTVVPMHFGTFPALKGTPEELGKLTTRKDVKVEAMKLGGVMTLRK